MYQVVTKNCRTLGQIEWPTRHVVFTGKNGSGKSTMMNAIKAAFTGSSIGGGGFDVFAFGGKASVTVTHDDCVIGDYPTGSLVAPPVIDLRAISGLTGPARSAALQALLNPVITAKDIELAIRGAIPAHEVAALMHLTRMEIDKAIEEAGRRKRDADAEAKSFGTVSVEVGTGTEALKRQIAEIRDRLTSVNTERRSMLVEQARAVEDRLGAYASTDPDRLQSVVTELKKRIEDISQQVTMERGLAAPIQGILATLNDSMKRLERGASLCPTCQSPITPELLQMLQSQQAEKQGALDTIQQRINALLESRKGLEVKQEKGSKILKDLNQLYDLRSEIKQLPASALSAEEVAAQKATMNGLQAKLDAEESRERKSLAISAAQATAKTARAVESALKTLKGEAVAAAGLPSSVIDIIFNVLGWRMEFDKLGRSWDLIIVEEDLSKRSVNTLSAGEWQVVYAAFATLLPNAWVLSECAEVDDEHHSALLKLLLDHPGVVIVSDWRDRTTPTGYHKIAFERI